MTLVEFYVDPSCPWAWVTSRWIKGVAPERDLTITWRSYCLEIRDDYGVAPTMPPERRDAAIAAHALSHRMLRVMEAVRADHGELAVDALFTAWGERYFGPDAARDARAASDAREPRDDTLVVASLETAGLAPSYAAAAGDDKWDDPIVEAMDVAYAFGGPKTQTPTLVIRDDPPHGFKGPVMSTVPDADAGLRLWDAIRVLSSTPGFYELTRPRRERPRPPAVG